MNRVSHPISAVFASLIPVLVGTVLIVASLLKLTTVAGVAVRDLSFVGTHVSASVVAIVEIFLGSILIAGVCDRLASKASILLLTVFCIYHARNLALGITKCSCLGNFNVSSVAMLELNLVLIALMLIRIFLAEVRLPIRRYIGIACLIGGSAYQINLTNSWMSLSESRTTGRELMIGRKGTVLFAEDLVGLDASQLLQDTRVPNQIEYLFLVSTNCNSCRDFMNELTRNVNAYEANSKMLVFGPRPPKTEGGYVPFGSSRTKFITPSDGWKIVGTPAVCRVEKSIIQEVYQGSQFFVANGD